MELRKFLSLFCALFAVSVAGCAARRNAALSSPEPAFAEQVRIPGISNAGKVNPFLYRGTQPKPEGIEQLRKLGVDTIFDLRGERRGTMEKERNHAESLGMQFVVIPGSGFSPPKDEQIAELFSYVTRQPKRTIFLHCWLGSDRSGVFIAAYRMTFDGWTPDRALEEMRAFHFKGFWHPAMIKYVRDFPARLERTPRLASFRQMVLSKKN